MALLAIVPSSEAPKSGQHEVVFHAFVNSWLEQGLSECAAEIDRELPRLIGDIEADRHRWIANVAGLAARSKPGPVMCPWMAAGGSGAATCTCGVYRQAPRRRGQAAPKNGAT